MCDDNFDTEMDIDIDGWISGRINVHGWMNGSTNGWMNGWTNGWIDGYPHRWMDKWQN